MGQSWLDLLFRHLPVDPDALRPHVPASLTLDLFDGAAWISAAAFEIRGTRLRGLPPAPWLSRFPELNVRTYVTHGDRPGIWFFSLDAPGALAVATARRVYRLPYFRAAMGIERAGPWVGFRSERVDRRGPACASWPATGRPARRGRRLPGTLDAWLVERYRLYAVDARGGLLSGDIHHEPWSLGPPRPRSRPTRRSPASAWSPPATRCCNEPPGSGAHDAGRRASRMKRRTSVVASKCDGLRARQPTGRLRPRPAVRQCPSARTRSTRCPAVAARCR